MLSFSHEQTLSILAYGFLAGSMFSILIMLIFDWIRNLQKRDSAKDKSKNL